MKSSREWDAFRIRASEAGAVVAEAKAEVELAKALVVEEKARHPMMYINGAHVAAKRAHDNAVAHGFWDGVEQPLQALAKRAHDNAVSHGFWDGVELDDVFARQVMLVVTELAEAVEAHRTQEHKAYYRVGDKTEGWAVELADAFIRLADIIGASEVDNIDEIVDEKMTYNESRPRKHGKRY